MRLAITGLGMVSSVGRGAVGSCAAIRAGIVRPRALLSMRVLDCDTQELVPVVGHPVAGYTEGFGAIGRWLRLTQGGVDDLIQVAHDPGVREASFWKRTGLICVGPHLVPERFVEAQNPGPEEIASLYLELVQRRLSLPFHPRESFYVGNGHSGAATALQLAEQRLESGCTERFLIVAADSYVDTASLEWLMDSHRLKTVDHPVGLMPGEASACILVEPDSSSLRRSGEARASVGAVATSQEPPRHILNRQPTTGEAMAGVLRSVLQDASPGRIFEGDIIADLNGEPWRANEWGCAQVRCSRLLKQDLHMVIPAASLGDTGAASGVIALCLAVRSFIRGYASRHHALVLSSSEHGTIAAMVVQSKDFVS